MGLVTLRTTVGVVNYTDWLHITAAKVLPTGGPGAPVWQDWVNVPFTNYNLVIPDLDPENYIVSFYDSPTDSSLGTLSLQLIVNALTNEWLYERRFYTCGGINPGDPAHGATSITDPYLIGKNITGTFKEAFRYFEPITETEFISDEGKINILNGTKFSYGEKFIVEIKYAAGTSGSGGGTNSGGLYNGVTNITEATRTILTGEKNTCCRLVGTATTQVITLPPVSGIANEEGWYFDNSCGGVAKCVKILTNPADDIRYNGFNSASNLFKEFWVGKGEHLLLRKFADNILEVRLDYKGCDVGEIVTIGVNTHPMVESQNGQLLDGDEWGRMWWWINNKLPSTHKYVTDTVVNTGFAHTANRRGQFAVHSTLKKFRMPKTTGLVMKGLIDYETLGVDPDRTVNAPGGFQAGAVGRHVHPVKPPDSNSASGYGKSATGGDAAEGTGITTYNTELNSGPVDNRIDNNGVIFGMKM